MEASALRTCFVGAPPKPFLAAAATDRTPAAGTCRRQRFGWAVSDAAVFGGGSRHGGLGTYLVVSVRGSTLQSLTVAQGMLHGCFALCCAVRWPAAPDEMVARNRRAIASIIQVCYL